ncbi:4-(cytidine 5'-diphospho)-2-C-methyl-D-erythritol kinase [Gynurincola endophyticus]|uniref:4-(cytidine 5'-diphospho)-2-C-methyl-D-erythritol kinase n=1 Tax=Gynurincola endophyticus TaxID=2479004 RepID=UPI000F8E9136|nr:4-(cytidine 5'-diphospho)-2-C-methyl-D-erythritol kinase [Gynurincola endophyticus]
MIAFPNAKINLGLHIVEKRADGFHNLETIFFPIQWNDALETIETNGQTTFCSYGLPIDSTPEQNLCFKAWNILHQQFQIPSVDIHLLKNIPMGAGLGGGSSDAAFTLRLLNNQFRLQLTDEQLIDFAARIGSDCAFFIKNTPCLAKGRGDVLTAIELSLNGYQILVVHPGIHISTPWAFQQIKPQPAGFDLALLPTYAVDEWRKVLFNQFEEPVFNAHPVTKMIKDQLYEQGALYAALSGSGSACFGIFPSKQSIDLSPFKSFATHLATY